MKAILFTPMLMISAILAYGQASLIPLYPSGVPNSKPTPAGYVEKSFQSNHDVWITMVSQPTLSAFLPEKSIANGTAVIICPGGGYAGLSMDKEGYSVAREFNRIGVAAFVLKNRLPSDAIMVNKTIGPLQDAQQAILMVRKNAAAWGIDPKKVGIMGFSAGGHLASTAGTHFDKAAIDNTENISLRPDFILLIYPVITFGPLTHAGSRENLIGKTPPDDLVELYSNEKQIRANTPPTFLVHAQDDDLVPVQNTLMFYDALLSARVKAEMHIFQEGGHGFGLNNPKTNDKWFDWVKNWLAENGF